jgi:hypothetical protein
VLAWPKYPWSGRVKKRAAFGIGSKKVCEDFLRSFDEEAVGHAFGLVEGNC